MATDSMPAEGSLSLTPGLATGQGDGGLALGAPAGLGLRIGSRPVVLGAWVGRIALATIFAGAALLVVFATGKASTLVPRSTAGFPGWESGPVHLLFGHPTLGRTAIQHAYSVFMAVMVLAYLAAVLSVRNLSMKLIGATVVAIHLVLLMSPPLALNDVFNYLGYARLGMLHHLDPYAHTIRSESLDPISNFATWHNLKSPYGPLFTAITYPIGLLPLPVAYWVVKTLMVGSSLCFVWLVHRCATLLKRDPRFAVAFVALNPIFLFYAVGGFHNDFFMLVPMLAAVAMLLQRKDRSAGAFVMLAVFVKFTAVLLLPFLLIAAKPAERRVKIAIGAGVATALLLVMDLILFGTHIPDIKDQSTLLTPYSVTNLVGHLLGQGGGSTTILHLADLGMIAVVLLFLWRRGDWLVGVGWSTLALICSLSWLMPWYVVWLLPLGALGSSLRLRWASLAATVFLVITFMPAWNSLMTAHHINLLKSPVGQASWGLEHRLSSAK